MEPKLPAEIAMKALARSRDRPSLLRPPQQGGIYAIYLRQGSSLAPFSPRTDAPIYVGSTSNLAEREFETHFGDEKTGFSTLRRSFGALLRDLLRLKAIPRSKGPSETNVRNYKFDSEGEKRLTLWMAENLEVGFCPFPSEYEQIEKDLISVFEPILNLKGWQNPNRAQIKRLRKICADEARSARE